MRILAFETSCDETSAAVVQDGRTVLSNVIATSKAAFERSGGVIPEEAARKQVECLLPVLHQALKEANCTKDDIDALAVTRGPGLFGSLVAGTVCVRALASVWGKPLVGVHHTLGHLSSTWLNTDDEPQFPVLTLSASGGHTELWLRTSHTSGRLIGRTRDDAAGEAFDKGASVLGLPYPGGPSIAKAAESGDKASIKFSEPLHKEETLDYSFSGLKTALKYTLRDHPEYTVPDLAASFQEAICNHLVTRLWRALEHFPDAKEIHIVGGVSANTRLRAMLSERIPGRTLRWPKTLAFCTDNAAMIAAATEFLIRERGAAAYQPFTTEASLALEAAVIRE